MTVAELGRFIVAASVVVAALGVIIGGLIAVVRVSIIRPLKSYVGEQMSKLTETNGGSHPADWMQDSQRDSAAGVVGIRELNRLLKQLRVEQYDQGLWTKKRIGQIAHQVELLYA